MKKQVRIFMVLLAVLLALASFTACKPSETPPEQSTEQTTSGNGDENTGTTAGNNTTTAPTGDQKDPEDEEREEYAPKQKDYNGYTFRMLLDSGTGGCKKYYAPVDNGDGDVIDLALYNRNEYLQEFFNIEIKADTSDIALSSLMPTKDAAGDDYADVVLGVSSLMRTVVPSGYVLDLSNVKELNLKASYWDQNIQKEYSINSMIFALEGDYTCYDELCTHGVLYNDDLYKEYGYYKEYGSPYEMVRDGNWTLDTMLAMIKDRSDINNTDTMTKNNQWGMLSEGSFPYIVFLGTGQKTIEVSRDGSLTLLFADDTQYETTYNLMEDCMKRIALNEEVLFAEASNGVLGSSGYWAEASNMFKSGKALFRTTTLSAALSLDDMEATFGILPVPKYTQKQDTYYSWCSTNSHIPVMVPATALSHLSTTANIMEAVCYTSKYMPNDQITNLEAFYENMTVIKICRKAEDYEMLELIYAHKTYDLDFTMNVTGVGNNLLTMAKQHTVEGLSSQLSSMKSASEKSLEKLLDDVASNVKN